MALVRTKAMEARGAVRARRPARRAGVVRRRADDMMKLFSNCQRGGCQCQCQCRWIKANDKTQGLFNCNSSGRMVGLIRTRRVRVDELMM